MMWILVISEFKNTQKLSFTGIYSVINFLVETVGT